MATPIKIAVCNGIGLVASIGSVLLGYLLIGHFVMATLTFKGKLGAPVVGDWYATVYFLTHSKWTFLLVGWVSLVLILAMTGFALAGRDRVRRNPASLSSISARFALGGFVAGLIDVLLVFVLLSIGRSWFH